MTFRYERLLERQKDLEHKSNGKISEDIQNVQKILEALVRQREETAIIGQLNNNNNNNSLHKSNEENASITDYYKIKAADWYASLLMYNSY